MLIPGFLNTRVPYSLPGSRPGSREPSNQHSYLDRRQQSTDRLRGHMQTELLFIAV